jgi:hypothetical protein
MDFSGKAGQVTADHRHARHALNHTQTITGQLKNGERGTKFTSGRNQMKGKGSLATEVTRLNRRECIDG